MQTKWMPIAAFVLPLLAGCAPRVPETCSFPGTSRMLVAQLFFGRGNVADTAWGSFAAETLTAHFPDGFTVLDAAGQWREAPGRPIAREASKLVIVAAPDTPATRDHLRDAMAAYRAMSGQTSVGLVLEGACASF